MTEPTEAQIKEACDLLNAGGPRSLWDASFHKDTPSVRTVARLIAQRDTERAEHEAYMQRVSEIVAPIHRALKQSADGNVNHLADHLLSLIQPDPTPTPEQVLAEVLAEAGAGFADKLVPQLLAKRGHHVAPIKDTRHD